jgi:glutamine cyclotransferase
MKFIKILSLILILTASFSCKKNNPTTKKTNENNISNFTSFKYKAKISIIQKKLKTGDIVNWKFLSDDKQKTDSFVVFVDNNRIKSFTNKNFSDSFDTKNFKVGHHKISVEIFKGNNSTEISKNFILFSNIQPKQQTYKIIKVFPHDRNAYTQGLVYDNGILYESTGLETKSTLRKEKLQTAEVLYSITIPNNFFGEGITILNNKIYQITWQDHVGFVYDKDNFRVISEFNYNTEGWGLATDGTKIFMSDGTNKIYFLDPTTLTQTGYIEVYDNKNPINLLNELEFINGILYANVYTKNFIVTIDPNNGKVLSKIDFTGILPNSLRTQNTDVLNGIAYDKKLNRIFITGKNWPRLYQVKIIDK